MAGDPLGYLNTLSGAQPGPQQANQNQQWLQQLMANQPQQPQQQQPQQGGNGLLGPIQDQLQRESQSLQSQQPTSDRGGPLKRMLFNFLGGAGAAMQRDAGLPTNQQLQQQHLQNIVSLTNAASQEEVRQSQEQYRQMMSAGLMQQQMPISQDMAAALGHPEWANIPMGQLPKLMAPAARVEAAQVGAGARIGVEQIKLQAAMGQVSKVMPVTDANGQMVMRAFNKYNQPIGDVDGAIPPASYLPKTSVEWKEAADGSFHALPKTSRPVIPGVTGPAAPAGGGAPAGGPQAPAFRGKNATQMMVGTDPQGRQVSGTPSELQSAGVNNYVKLDSAEAAKVNTARQMTSPGGLFSLIDQDLARFKPGELEALGPRWNEFLAGTVGTADPRYVQLRTHVNGLLSTALMQAHVGARGGERIMEHFEDIANAGKMSLPTLKTALNAERQYVEEKAMRPGGAPGGGTGGGGNMIFARDPQGKLHQAPAGTQLPQGWTLGR